MADSTISTGPRPTYAPPVGSRANKGEQPAVAAEPEDTYVAGQAGRDPAVQSMRALAAQDRAKTAAIDGMVARDTRLSPPTADETGELHRDLGKVDTSVLQFAQERGVKIQVVRPGDDLREARVLRAQDPKDIDAQMPEMAAFSKRVNDDLSKRFDAPMAKLQGERSALMQSKGVAERTMPMLGFGQPPDPEVQALDAQIGKLGMERNKATADALNDTKLPVTTFHVPTPPGMSGMFAHAAMVQSNMPMSTEGMALVHGFRTPDERAQFNRWVEAINGDRVTTARNEAMQGLDQALKNDPDNAELKKLKEDAKAHPERIHIDHRRHNILVPDIHAYREPVPGESPFDTSRTPTEKPMFLDEHDRGTLRNWNGFEGKRIEESFDPRTGKGTPQLGQYFHKGDVKRILVMNGAISGGTPAHELGHAVEDIIEKQDPKFYGPWKQRLDTAYEQAGKGPLEEQISGYSRTSPKEYLAEGFEHYYDDPKTLKFKDPDLYALVHDLTQRASHLQAGGAK